MAEFRSIQTSRYNRCGNNHTFFCIPTVTLLVLGVLLFHTVCTLLTNMNAKPDVTYWNVSCMINSISKIMSFVSMETSSSPKPLLSYIYTVYYTSLHWQENLLFDVSCNIVKCIWQRTEFIIWLTIQIHTYTHVIIEP